MANKIMMSEFLGTKEFFTPTQYNLIKALENNGPITRRDLVKKLSKARTTLYDNLLKLQERKIVEKFTRNDGNRGRPLVFWKMKD